MRRPALDYSAHDQHAACFCWVGWPCEPLCWKCELPLSLLREAPADVQLPYRVRWQDLKDLFRKAGTVLRADVSLGSDNRSRGYGTVLMGSREDAARAIGKSTYDHSDFIKG